MNKLLAKLKDMSKRPLITGTFILTLTGLVSRLIGFFYRIYLSRLFGEENLGIYQLISPVVSLAFSLCAAGYQTAVSKMTAELAACLPWGKNNAKNLPLWASLSISLPLALVCTLLTYFGAVPIGCNLLREPRTVPLLRTLAFSFPFVGVHACINGWFYGMKKAGLPALAQIIEQLTRVTCVFLITAKDLSQGRMPDVHTAVLGLAIGEIVSMTVAVLTFLPYLSLRSKHTSVQFVNPPVARPLNGIDSSSASRSSTLPPMSSIYHGILGMALPLTANRLVLTFLGSIESVAIPERLRAHGYDVATSLSVYGVLTGMALPLIFFPNALTGSIAVMLLPMISENHCLCKTDVVRALTFRTLKYCLMIGMACLSVFVLFGPTLGSVMFHSALAGRCIRTLGWICPFLYLDVMLSSILQGLGKAGTIFVINVLSLMTRLAFVYLAIPRFGLRGYLWGMLAGQLLLTALFALCLYRFFSETRNKERSAA